MSTALANYKSDVTKSVFENNEANMNGTMANGAELYTNISYKNVSHSFCAGTHSSVPEKENRMTSIALPGDVFKLFSGESKYKRGPPNR